MRSDRKKQIMTLSILLITVFVISIGFAAFSRTFQFEPTVSVSPDSRMFAVKFSTTSGNLTTGTVTPNVMPSQETLESSKEIIADDINIDGSTMINGLYATFISPGDSVSYTFYAINTGEYDAYLNSINFSNITCKAGVGTTESLVEQACNGIRVSASINNIGYNSSINPYGHKLNKKNSEKVTITITYDDHAIRADGPFTVEGIGVSLYYSTVDGRLNEDSYVCKMTNDVNGNKEVNFGDEVTCGTESFYVIPNDSSAHPTATNGNITLITKYNLNVGADTSSGILGIQNKDATGLTFDSNGSWDYSSCNFTEQQENDYFNNDEKEERELYLDFYKAGYGCSGSMPFSESGYWGEVDDVTFVYNNQSLLYQPVESYKTYMKNLGVNVTEASLVSYDQMIDVFDLYETDGLYRNFNFTSFWLGSSLYTDNLYFMYSYGDYTDDLYYYSTERGVRPVIIMPLSEIDVS